MGLFNTKIEIKDFFVSVDIGCGMLTVKLQDKEIDFVATKQNEKIYVQVTQEIKSEKTQKREYEQLLEIKDKYADERRTSIDMAS